MTDRYSPLPDRPAGMRDRGELMGDLPGWALAWRAARVVIVLGVEALAAFGGWLWPGHDCAARGTEGGDRSERCGRPVSISWRPDPEHPTSPPRREPGAEPPPARWRPQVVEEVDQRQVVRERDNDPGVWGTAHPGFAVIDFSRFRSVR